MRVFFELNGQPRRCGSPNRKAAGLRTEAAEGRRRQPRAGRARRCRGWSSNVAVKDGQPVKAGDLMLTHRGDEDGDRALRRQGGTVKALHVQPGAQVDAKDLLVELSVA